MAEPSSVPTSRGERASLAARAGHDLLARLDDVLGDRLRRAAKRPRDGAGWVDVSGHDLSVPRADDRSTPTDDFVMSTATVAGAVGRFALRERADGEPVGVAVARVLGALSDADQDAAWFADWCTEELDRSGRAAVAAAATTWATGALGAVGGRRLVWSTRRESYDVPGRAVRLRTSWDAADHAARPEVLVVMSARAPSDPAAALVAGFNALVDGMHRRQVPARVRIGSASTASTTAFPITWELLDATIDRVVEVVRCRVEPS
ncbi:MAG: hypothetical protein JST64_04355 [Actinobacteria bacterium]|nr:hypothetical protein [Actinomycetota bacterium]